MSGRWRGALGAAVVSVLLVCGGAVAAADPPAPASLDGGAWSYVADPSGTGVFAGRASGEGDGWAPIAVPGVVDSGLTRRDFAGQIGWYRLVVAAPADAPAGYSWAVRFGQVRRTAEVYLDGRRLATHDDPYAAFTVPLPGLRADVPSTLVVRVDNHRGLAEGWWNWGGLIGSVTLVPQGPVVVRDAALMPTLRCTTRGHCDHARLLLAATLTNATHAAQVVRLGIGLTAPRGAAGGAVTARSVPVGTIAPGATVSVRASVPVAGRAVLWAPGHPSLYAARITTTTAAAGVVAVNTLDVGLREVAVRGGLLTLNGRSVRLRGASIEQDVPATGPVVSDAQIAQMIGELHALHATVTRAQYPVDERILSAFDHAGILFWQQAPVYSRDAQLRTARQRAFALSQLKHTILADRSHPSVLTNSVANELATNADRLAGTRRYLAGARVLDQQLDPTRPASVDILGWPDEPRERSYAQFPLLGLDCYYGWYTGPRGHRARNPASLAPFLARTRRQYRGAALVMTEFGAEATRPGGPAAQRLTYAFQSRYVARTLRTVDRAPFMSGAIYWTLREFAIKPRWEGGAGLPVRDTDSLHHKGLITYTGRRKPAFSVAAAIFGRTALYRR